MIIVIVVFKVRGVSVQQHVTVVIETVKYPKPHHGAKPGAQRLVREGRVVERHAFVRDPMTLARCVDDEEKKETMSVPKNAGRASHRVVLVKNRIPSPSKLLNDREDAPTTRRRLMARVYRRARTETANGSSGGTRGS